MLYTNKIHLLYNYFVYVSNRRTAKKRKINILHIFLHFHISAVWFLGINMSIDSGDEIIQLRDTDGSECSDSDVSDDYLELDPIDLDPPNTLHVMGHLLFVDITKNTHILAQCTVQMYTQVYEIHDPFNVFRALCLRWKRNDDGLVEKPEKILHFKSSDINKYGKLRFMFSRTDSNDVVLIPVVKTDTFFFVFLLINAKSEICAWMRHQEKLGLIEVQTSRRSTVTRLSKKLQPWFPSAKSFSMQISQIETLYVITVKSSAAVETLDKTLVQSGLV